ncbi:DUF2281 domain-containing protein [Iningainema tapete]|uniref:DUF2281 domain-containing protein n=1 Tax=Iningainema tapete BLCC-T55 TaxID=2748662 RepID=A0A8J6XSD9_9CYAN|nr:DUF2281 domain-containing protein [Iningainema tapete]MBD2776646.1 DUF2281 domain-containing protein [Iningainema tapete BLCC-T55]
MTIKELLLEEIESASENLLAETLDFLRFLKTKPTQTQPETQQNNANNRIATEPQTSVHSTGNSLLEHLKTIGTWEGDDFEECLEMVYATRGKANFNQHSNC